MGDNNEQEAADLAAMNDDDDDDDLLEVIYRGDQLVNIPNVPFRLIIDSSVTEIDEDACFDCTTLTEVIFHNKVTTIGRYAFGRCSNLQPVELPEGLLRVGDHAFDGCNSLRGEIVIPATVQYIGHCAFERCVALHRVIFAQRTTSVELGNAMFRGCSDLRLVALPQNLRSIPAWFFMNCISLTRLHIPKSVQQLEEYAFRGSGIHATKTSEEDEFIPGTIMLPPKLRSILENCFEDCKSLSHIRVPPSVQSIGENALNRSELRSITIPETVHWMGREALGNCALLEKVTFHSSTNLIMDNDIFTNCPRLTVIKIAPWLWPKLFASLKEQPEFIFRFIRHYSTQILDFETPDVRLFRRLRRDKRRR